MSTKSVRTALCAPLLNAGFVEEGVRFVYRTTELLHSIEVASARRLTGFVHLLHHIAVSEGSEGDLDSTLTEELASYGHRSPYPKLWSSTSIDATLVLAQVSALVRAFQSRADLAHFYSDGPHMSHGASAVAAISSEFSEKCNALSATDSSQVLAHLAREILGGNFSPAPRLGPAMWVNNAEVGGFCHCAYLESNHTCTLGVIVYFSLPARDIERGVKHDDTLRKLLVAPKRIFHAEGGPVLLALSPSTSPDVVAIKSALAQHLHEHPPNHHAT